MGELEHVCPKCAGAMEVGFIADQARANSTQVEKWVEGEPKLSWWTGLKIYDRKQLSVRTYRCEDCGFLESYAVEE